jgi:hypothetical protein
MNIKKGYRQDYKAKDITADKSEAEYFKKDCYIGLKKTQNSHNW